MKKGYLFLFLVIIISPWTWVIADTSLIIFIVLIITSVLIYRSLYLNELSNLYNKTVICLFLIAYFHLITNSFDKSLIEIYKKGTPLISKRQEYFSRELGKIYRNRYGIFYFNKIEPVLFKYLNNISYAIDLQTYFLPINENAKSKYPIYFIPFLLVGLFYIIEKPKKLFFITTILSILLLGFINTRNSIGPMLLYPIIGSIISLGAMKLINKKI